MVTELDIGGSWDLYLYLTQGSKRLGGFASPGNGLKPPRFTGALTAIMEYELRELVKAASANEDAFVVVRRLLESGTPLVRAEIDWLVAPGTGDAIVTYHVTDEVQRHLAAFKTLQRDSGGVKKRNGHLASSGSLAPHPLNALAGA
jgi:hypothetical protein